MLLLFSENMLVDALQVSQNKKVPSQHDNLKDVNIRHGKQAFQKYSIYLLLQLKISADCKKWTKNRANQANNKNAWK